MKAVSLIFRKITTAEFNAISDIVVQKNGGGQTYIDFPKGSISDEQMSSFLGVGNPTSSASYDGFAWNFEVHSLYLGKTQNAEISVRRKGTNSLRNQTIGNRIAILEPENGFPLDNYNETSNPIIFYILKNDNDEYWAGWFYRNDYSSDWFLTLDLSIMFYKDCSYIQLNTPVDIDESNREWPFKGIATVKNNKHAESNVQQIIYYGAPGTGKSYGIKRNHGVTKENSFRTTFHPDSDYSTFVGCYKPIKDKETGDITYEFVPQVFTEAYIAAWRNYAEGKPIFLIIEEINRGNCAQIFGDLFQLLDRNDNGYSDYEIKPEKDLQKFLAEEFAGEHDSEDNPAPAIDLEEFPNIVSGKELILPPNLNIIATMNTSDQSLFPIDSAFKRRWNWRYVAIMDAQKSHQFEVDGVLYDWWKFVKQVNDAIKNITESEDKKMGYFFVRPDKKFKLDDEKATIITTELFVSKVLFYLWTDVFKDYSTDTENNIFRKKIVGVDENGNDKYEAISFTDFFNEMGNVNTETVKSFLAQFDFTSDETAEEDEDGNTSSTSTRNRDYTKYSVNGQGSYGKNVLAYWAVKKYVDLNKDMSSSDVLNNWSSLDIGVSHFIESEQIYNARTDNDKSRRSKPVRCGDGINVYVAVNGYSSGNGMVDRLISAVNAKAQDWKITLTKM